MMRRDAPDISQHPLAPFVERAMERQSAAEIARAPSLARLIGRLVVAVLGVLVLLPWGALQCWFEARREARAQRERKTFSFASISGTRVDRRVPVRTAERTGEPLDLEWWRLK
jgi:hypothetical protein